METFANQAVTTLSAAITSVTATSCTVVDATAFPASGNFRIKIDSEILIVTGVAGNTFTITRGAEGTTAATHANGANVIHLLTKGGLEARVANRFITDLYANKPAAGVKGRLFLPTDGLFLEYDDGAAWHKYGPYRRFKAPPETGWSWVNQGNATATYSDGRIVLEDPDLDSTDPQLRIYVRPAPQWPATLTLAYLANGIGGGSSPYPQMGFCTRQHSPGISYDGYLAAYGIMLGGTQWQSYGASHISPTNSGSSFSWDDYFMPQRLIWGRLEVYGDRKRFYMSVDGVNFIKVKDDSISSYGINQVGIFIDPKNNAQPVSLSLVHWEEG